MPTSSLRWSPCGRLLAGASRRAVSAMRSRIASASADQRVMVRPDRPQVQPHAAPRLDRQPHVLEHAQVREQVGQLERAAQAAPRALGRRERGDLVAADEHLPGAGLELTGDQVEVGGLAGAVGPDDRGQRAGLERARHGVDGDVAAEPDRQLPRFERRGHRCVRWCVRDAGVAARARWARGRCGAPRMGPNGEPRSRPSAALRCSPPRAAAQLALAAAALRALRLGARTVLADFPRGDCAARRLRGSPLGPMRGAPQRPRAQRARAATPASGIVAACAADPVVETAPVSWGQCLDALARALVMIVFRCARSCSLQPCSSDADARRRLASAGRRACGAMGDADWGGRRSRRAAQPPREGSASTVRAPSRKARRAAAARASCAAARGGEQRRAAEGRLRGPPQSASPIAPHARRPALAKRRRASAPCVSHRLLRIGICISSGLISRTSSGTPQANAGSFLILKWYIDCIA